MSECDWVPIGDAQFTDLSSAVILATATPATGTAYSALVDSFGNKAVPRHALITVETQAIRTRTNGSSPTASLGTLQPAGRLIVIKNAPDVIRKLRMIEVAASASVNVEYFL